MNMGELVEAVDLDVSPDYRMFGLGDEYAGGDETPVPAPGFLGVGRHSFLVGTGAATIDPAVRLEHWQGGLPEPPPEYEVQERFELELPTGELVLNLITMGGDSGFMTLPAGTHTVRVTGWERESTRSAEFALFDHDIESEEFGQARDALNGHERYLIQFALKTASARLVDFTGSGIREGLDRLVVTDDTRTPYAVIPANGVTSVELQLWDAAPPQASPNPTHHPGLTGFTRACCRSRQPQRWSR
jgi:hypothetical protein